jgi:ABC-type uncharacterized transport system auxiliary subunit
MKNLLLPVFLMFLAGCSIFPDPPYVPVHYFDLGYPAPSGPRLKLKVRNVNTIGPYYEKMVFRTSANSMKFDEFNRWSDLPDRMLRRYFILAFEPDAGQNGKPGGKVYVLDAEILQFEGNLSEKTAGLTVKIVLSDPPNGAPVFSQVFQEKAPVQGDRAEDYAASMGKAVANITAGISATLDKIP